jgi:hypothetical protein
VSCLCCIAGAEPPFTLFWYPGDTASIRVSLLQSDGVTPFDLTDSEVSFFVAADDQPGAALLWDLTATDGSLILDAPGGVALLSPGATRSAALAFGKTYPARLELVTEDGELVSLRPGYLVTYPAVPVPASA